MTGEKFVGDGGRSTEESNVGCFLVGGAPRRLFDPVGRDDRTFLQIVVFFYITELIFIFGVKRAVTGDKLHDDVEDSGKYFGPRADVGLEVG